MTRLFPASLDLYENENTILAVLIVELIELAELVEIDMLSFV